MAGEAGNIASQLQNISTLTRILVQPVSGPQFECTLYINEGGSAYIVVYGSRLGNEVTDLRILKTTALRRVTPLSGDRTAAAGVSGKSTPKKGGSTTPARRGSRPETPNPPTSASSSTTSKDELNEDGKLLLTGLAKHLSVKTRGKAIIVNLTNSEARIDPPYTKVEGEGDEMARVRRILESERSVLPKRGKKKDVKVPAMGG